MKTPPKKRAPARPKAPVAAAPVAELAALRAQVEAGPLPRHVGIIMDGNGRWAEQRGRPRLDGHAEGSRSVRAITTLARELGLEAVTLYAFSTQNWSRPADEVAGLMKLLAEYLVAERKQILGNGIRLRTIGDTSRLPRPVRFVLDELVKASAKNGGLSLTLALSYGGREELTRAAQKIAQDVAAGRLAPEDVDEAAVAARLYTAELPELDLCVRTSGELRVSNFLLWQLAYAEIVVVDTLWPDFRELEFLRALRAFQGRERRFGKTGQQARGAAK